jgi:release factor glutamine methyltransferase
LASGDLITLVNALQQAITQLEAAKVSSPVFDAEWLLIFALGATRAVLLEPNRILSDAELETYQSWVNRRASREPLQWIIGSTEFYGFELKVRVGVLIPRPETERLVELTLERLGESGRVVDVGCGSGAIAIAIQKERPRLEVWATDINPNAIALTLENAKHFKLNIHTLETSLLHGLKGQFSAIVSNPPYLPNTDFLEPEVQLEPPTALFSGEDGLGLARELVLQAPNYLTSKGFLLLELDPRNAPVLYAEMQNNGWQVSLEADLSGRKRFIVAQK